MKYGDYTIRYDTIRYDTIRDAILTCARKPTYITIAVDILNKKQHVAMHSLVTVNVATL